jgi:hypothetical protein
MNASGGAAAPLNGASEEYGATAPKHERVGDDDEKSTTGAASRSGNQQSSGGGSEHSQGNQQSSSGGSGNSQSKQQSSNGGKSSHSTHNTNDLEQISREKAQRYTNLNEQDVQHAGGPDKSKSEADRSSQRAPKDVGPKEDIEQLHGKATLSGNDKANDIQSGQQESKSGSGKSGQHDSKSGSGGNGGAEHGGHELEDSMRHNAEKFVNLSE